MVKKIEMVEEVEGVEMVETVKIAIRNDRFKNHRINPTASYRAADFRQLTDQSLTFNPSTFLTFLTFNPSTYYEYNE